MKFNRWTLKSYQFSIKYNATTLNLLGIFLLIFSGLIMRLNVHNSPYLASCLEALWKFWILAIDKFIDSKIKGLIIKHTQDREDWREKETQYQLTISHLEKTFSNQISRLKSEIHQVTLEKSDFESLLRDMTLERDILLKEQKKKKILREPGDDLATNFLSIQNKLEEMNSNIDNSILENKSQSSLIQNNLLNCCMILMQKGFRSRMKSQGTQSDISFAAGAYKEVKIGLQPYLVDPALAIKYIKHPFFNYIDCKMIGVRKVNMIKIVDDIEALLDMAYAYAKKNADVLSAIVLASKQLNPENPAATVTSFCDGVIYLVKRKENYGKALSIIFGLLNERNNDFYESSWEFFNIWKTIKDKLPHKRIAFKDLDETEINYFEFREIFERKSSFLYGESYLFRSLLDEITESQIEDQSVVIADILDVSKSSFMASLEKREKKKTVNSYKKYLTEIFALSGEKGIVLADPK